MIKNELYVGLENYLLYPGNLSRNIFDFLNYVHTRISSTIASTFNTFLNSVDFKTEKLPAIFDIPIPQDFIAQYVANKSSFSLRVNYSVGI